jgi:hypothetical protein
VVIVRAALPYSRAFPDESTAAQNDADGQETDWSPWDPAELSIEVGALQDLPL